MVTFTRRLATIMAALALCAGNVAVCAGWLATPEGRMACCMSGKTCPMHKSEGHDRSSKGAVSQAQAASCCRAGAQRRDSAAAGSPFASSGVIALVPAAPFTVPVTAPTAQEWRALVPLPVPSVPKHLLLSVLLV